jgi:hypothetical protein
VRAFVPVAAALVAVLASIIGCSDPANTQYVPIGSRCTSGGQCGTMPFDCNTAGYPGGYCTKSCTTDGDCPLDAACIDHACRRRCVHEADCRQNEGYSCAQSSGTTVCLPGVATMDLGRPSG